MVISRPITASQHGTVKASTVASSCTFPTIAANKSSFDKWLHSQGSSSQYLAKWELKCKYELDDLKMKHRNDDNTSTIPAGMKACDGNLSFQCDIGYHVGMSCPHSVKYWKEMRSALTHHSFHLERKKPSLQKLLYKLDGRVLSEDLTTAEVLMSPTFVRVQPYIINNGPVCSFCERRVHKLEQSDPPTCKPCAHRNVTVYRDVTAQNLLDYPLPEARSWDSERTLVFLCGRKSGVNCKLDKDYFNNLLDAFKLSETHIGPYGDTNRPGFPKPILVVGKFASAASARSPLTAMSTATDQQPKDVATLNMLQDYIVNAYWPGDTVVIAMSQPTAICIGHQDLDKFIQEVFQRGIPERAFFLFCRGLNSSKGSTIAYETNVLAADLRAGILSNIPRYGVWPAVSAYLYAAEVGVTQRFNAAPKGRNKIVVNVTDSLTASQSTMKCERNELAERLVCAFPECRGVIGLNFAVQCSICVRWHLGRCVELSAVTAQELNLHNLEWLCPTCSTQAVLGQHYLKQDKLALAVACFKAGNDYSFYSDVCPQENSNWATLVDYLTYFAGKCSLLDLHCLYATSRIGNWDYFKRVLSMASLERSAILDLAKCIEHESYSYHPEPEMFATHLRSHVNAVCVTPQLSSPERTPARSGIDEEDVAQVAKLSSLSISDDGDSVSQKFTVAGGSDLPSEFPSASHDQQPSKRRRLLSASSSTSSTVMPPPPPPAASPSAETLRPASRVLKTRMSLRGWRHQ